MNYQRQQEVQVAFNEAFTASLKLNQINVKAYQAGIENNESFCFEITSLNHEMLHYGVLISAVAFCRNYQLQCFAHINQDGNVALQIH